MTRLIQSSLIAVIILLAIAFGFYYFINKGAGIEAVMKAVPSDAACVLKMKLDAETAEEISKNVLLTKFRYVPAIEKFNALLQRIKDESAAGSPFQIFANNDLFLSVHATKTNNFDVLYLMPTTQVTSEEMKTLAESVWGKITNVQNAIMMVSISISLQSTIRNFVLPIWKRLWWQVLLLTLLKMQYGK
nr:hypothetical protein [Bacteroidota bacterium]